MSLLSTSFVASSQRQLSAYM